MKNNGVKSRGNCHIPARVHHIPGLFHHCSTILSVLGLPFPHDFVFGNSRATSQWVTHPGNTLASFLLTEPEANELPKCLMLGRDENIHLRITSLGDVRCYSNVNPELEWSEEEWNHLLSKFVAIHMRDADQGGSIVNISSIDCINHRYLSGATTYNCSKASINTLTKTMAIELGVHKIRVNAISPGLFKWLHNVAMKTVPLQTFGTSDPALTSLVRYLPHDYSEYVSGNIYIIDAGTTLPGVPIFSSL
ncbi:unnamed protein product [Malus baccata var. baccata]